MIRWTLRSEFFSLETLVRMHMVEISHYTGIPLYESCEELLLMVAEENNA